MARATTTPASATALIAPSGKLIGHTGHGAERLVGCLSRHQPGGPAEQPRFGSRRVSLNLSQADHGSSVAGEQRYRPRLDPQYSHHDINLRLDLARSPRPNTDRLTYRLLSSENERLARSAQSRCASDEAACRRKFPAVPAPVPGGAHFVVDAHVRSRDGSYGAESNPFSTTRFRIGAPVTGATWFLLPILTPILVMLAALVLQRFETIVMNQIDPVSADNPIRGH